MPFRVKLLGCVSFLASPACPIQCRINHWGDKFGIWSRNGSSHVTPIAERCSPPLRHIKRVLLLVLFGVSITLLSRNCNINTSKEVR